MKKTNNIIGLVIVAVVVIGIIVVVSQRNRINGHEYVDLGLSVKWATCNVGAEKPEENGDYYAWGEKETKSSYDYTKANYDSKTQRPNVDVAQEKWGSPWRMPTLEEFQELIANCTWEWTTKNGVNGYKVTSIKNGKSIFLPAAGYRTGISFKQINMEGHYWSSTWNSTDRRRTYDHTSNGKYYEYYRDETFSYKLYFNNVNIESPNRVYMNENEEARKIFPNKYDIKIQESYYGLPVRPVTD